MLFLKKQFDIPHKQAISFILMKRSQEMITSRFGCLQPLAQAIINFFFDAGCVVVVLDSDLCIALVSDQATVQRTNIPVSSSTLFFSVFLLCIFKR